MAWIKSLLADFPGVVDPAWLKPTVTVAAFLDPFVRNAVTYSQPKVRAEYQQAIATDRKLLEESMQPGDLLRPWRDPRGNRQVGIALVRGEEVVKAWLTAVLIDAVS